MCIYIHTHDGKNKSNMYIDKKISKYMKTCIGFYMYHTCTDIFIDAHTHHTRFVCVFACVCLEVFIYTAYTYIYVYYICTCVLAYIHLYVRVFLQSITKT